MLRLERVHIVRFRGILEGTIEGLADVNIFVGRNNSGKSTVAEAIVRLAAGALVQAMGGDPDSDPRARQKIDPWSRTRTGYLENWYRSDQTQPWQIAGRIGSTEFAVQQPMPPPTGRRPVGQQPPGSSAERAFLDALAFFLPQDANDANIERAAWPSVLAHRQDKLLTTGLQDLFHLPAEQLQLLPDGQLMLLLPDHGVSLQAQGEGVRAALRCLIRLTPLQRTLFILEHPESHQHPGSLVRFAATLCKQAGQAEVQLLVTTHSIECVKAFLDGADAAKSETAVFHLGLSDGLLAVRRLEASTARTLQGNGTDVRLLDLYA